MADQTLAIAPAVVIDTGRARDRYMTVVLCPHVACANDVSVHSHVAGDGGEILTGSVRAACGGNAPPYDVRPAGEADVLAILAAVRALGGQWSDVGAVLPHGGQ